MKIFFTVPGEPQGKARPRVTRYGTYTPEKTKAYEALVKLKYKMAAEGFGGFPGPVGVQITAYFGIPKSYTKARREAILAGTEKPVKKPDCDNIVKIILDALNGSAWRDDAQVLRLTVEKRYIFHALDAPAVHIEIEGE